MVSYANMPQSQRVTKAPLSALLAAPRSTVNGLFPADVCSLQTEASFSDLPCPGWQDKENQRGLTENRSWLSKVCSKLRSKHRRHEKCEKCGQRSDTCQANPSFVSSRKHYLCQDCRVSSRNMKSMYHQLCRNLSLREPSTRTVCHSGDVSPLASSSRSDGLARSKSMRGVTARQTPESGYETATSLDSSCSNGRLSPDPVSTSSGEGTCCTALHVDRLHDSPLFSQRVACPPVTTITDTTDLNACSKDSHVCSKDKADIVFSSPVVKREKTSLHELQAHKPQQWVYTRQQQKQKPTQQQQQQQQQPEIHHHHHPHNDLKNDGKRYDGYLEVRKVSSHTVTYVFKKTPSSLPLRPQQQHKEKQKKGGAREGVVGSGGDGADSAHTPGSDTRHSHNLKQCYRCSRSHSVAFRAPFCHGWLCEDCMDDLM